MVTAEELMKEQTWISADACALTFGLHGKPAVAGPVVGGKRKQQRGIFQCVGL